MPEDYYKTLGVSRDASDDEIQKAYRKLARKYHPDLADDKEAAKEQFQKVQHAYDVLSDEKKRKLYDRLGPEFERAGGYHGQMPEDVDIEQIFGGSMPQGGFEDILRQIFGGGAPMGGFQGGDPRGGRGGFYGGFPGGGFEPGGTRTQTQQAPARGRDLEQTITIPFATAVLGGKHQVTLQRSSGDVENITITIPAGIADGKKIRLRGQGASPPRGGQRGDLFIKVNVAPHPSYQREGDNLRVILPVTVSEAIRGAKIDLPTPHGTVTLTVPPDSSSGRLLRMKGLGVKHKDGSAGDLIAELKIEIPDNLNEEQRKLLDAFAESIEDFNPRSGIRW